MKVKLVDAIGIVLVVVGIAMTAMILFGHRAGSDVQGFTIEEIPSPPSGAPAFPAPDAKPI